VHGWVAHSKCGVTRPARLSRDRPCAAQSRMTRFVIPEGVQQGGTEFGEGSPGRAQVPRPSCECGHGGAYSGILETNSESSQEDGRGGSSERLGSERMAVRARSSPNRNFFPPFPLPVQFPEFTSRSECVPIPPERSAVFFPSFAQRLCAGRVCPPLSGEAAIRWGTGARNERTPEGWERASTTRGGSHRCGVNFRVLRALLVGDAAVEWADLVSRASD
jgi:hypothetical protein